MDALTLCPRCGAEVEQTYYGPCEMCRQELRGGARAQLAGRRAVKVMHAVWWGDDG